MTLAPSTPVSLASRPWNLNAEGVVLDAELVQHRGVQVVHGADVLDGGVAEFVGRAVDDAALDAGAGEPHGHGLVVMIAADGTLVALRHRRAAELAGPDDQRVVEHAALLEVGDQRRAGLVDFAGAQRQLFLQQAVMIPVAVVELDEAHAAFGQAAGEQAVRGKRAVARLAAVELERLRRLRRSMSISSGTLACI